MDEGSRLPPGWVAWHTDPGGGQVWTFRPDIFDADRFSAPCLPTLTVSRARRRGPRGRPAPNDRRRPWAVALRLEPTVLLDRTTVPDRDEATSLAREWAAAFSGDEYDCAAAYGDHPRDDYLDTLGALLPADPCDFSGDTPNERP